jgi:hypothetical protein
MTRKKLIPTFGEETVLTALLKHMEDCDNVDIEHKDH